MTQYLISFDAHAMDHISDEDGPDVGKAAHAVVQEAINAGVLVCTGGLENQKASIVATDGTVTDGPYPEAVGGITIVEVPSREEALEWAASREGTSTIVSPPMASGCGPSLTVPSVATMLACWSSSPPAHTSTPAFTASWTTACAALATAGMSSSGIPSIAWAPNEIRYRVIP